MIEYCVCSKLYVNCMLIFNGRVIGLSVVCSAICVNRMPAPSGRIICLSDVCSEWHVNCMSNSRCV